ncbi:unnamed protein product [Ectocarpus sp. 8 AP-2014]
MSCAIHCCVVCGVVDDIDQVIFLSRFYRNLSVISCFAVWRCGVSLCGNFTPVGRRSSLLHDCYFLQPFSCSSSRNLVGSVKPFRFSSRLAPCLSTQGMALVAAVKTQLRHWKPLLSKLNVEAGDDVEMIKVVESYALRPECEGTLRAVFRYVVQSFFQEEMVSEDCLERWIQLRRATPQGSPERGLFEQKEVQAFVAWLEDSESSSGEEGDDSDSDDEESTDEDE